MANHTPGPWGIRALMGENLSVCDESVGPGLYPIAQSIEGHTEDEQNANARLIAAAPELYEALKLAYQRSNERAESRVKWTQKDQNAHEAIHAALLRVEGISHPSF